MCVICRPRAVILAATLGLMYPAAASELPGESYVGAFATGIVTDDDRRLDDGFAGGGIILGYPLSEQFNFEMTGQYLSLDGDGSAGVDTDQIVVSLNFMNVFNRPARFSPYLIGGLGWVNTDPDVGEDEDNLQLQGGAGLLTDLFSRRFSLRTEALYRWENGDREEFGDWLFNIGFSYAYGAAAEAFLDSDADGVSDDLDRCPDTVLGASVNDRGCEPDSDGDGIADRIDPCPDTPRGATVDARGCATDRDGDGVADGIDQCPQSPAGLPVDGLGCLLDGDGDGVHDGRDQCPDSPADALVDDAGCSYRLEGINFGYDSADILPAGKRRLDAAAEQLNAQAALRIVVEGHTDSRGDADYNLRLSRARAGAVAEYLRERGVADSRMRIVGLGESRPVADNATEAGRAQNRRVVLKVERR